MTKKLRIGILSTSSIVPRFINAAKTLDGCEVTSLASRNLAKAEEKARLWGVPKAYGSYEDLICSEDIDIVYVAMINSEHSRYTQLALEHGKHVFCEKPFAMTEEEARRLFSLARKKGLFVMEMQKTLFLPAVQKAKELLNSGSFGKIHMANFSSSFDPGYNDWLFDPEKGGGTLFSSGIYSVELMQYLFDSPVKAWSGLCTRAWEDSAEDQFSASFLLENGLLFTSRNSTRVTFDHSAFFYGEKGCIELPEYWKARKIILHYKGQEPVIFEYPCNYELVYEIRHAKDCIRSKITESPVMTEELTAGSIRALEGLKRLWNQG